MRRLLCIVRYRSHDWSGPMLCPTSTFRSGVRPVWYRRCQRCKHKELA